MRAPAPVLSENLRLAPTKGTTAMKRPGAHVDKGEVALAGGLLLAGLSLLRVTQQIAGEAQGTRLFPQTYLLVVIVGSMLAAGRHVLERRRAARARRTHGPVEAVPIAPASADAGSQGRGRAGAPRVPDPGAPASMRLRVGTIVERLQERIEAVPGPLAMTVAILFYIGMLEVIGYIVATLTFTILMTAVFQRHLTWRSLVYPVFLTLFLYFSFEQLLNIRLP